MDNFYCTQNVSLNQIVHTIGDGICLTDNNMVFVAVNQRLAEFYGKNASDLLGKSVFDFYPDFRNSVFYEASDHTLKTGEPATRIGYSNNLKKWIVVRTFKYDDNHGVMYIHELKTGFDKRCYVGNYDSLTSLYNRFTFEEDLQNIFKSGHNFGVAILDINKFKQINESFGYEVGDMCLMETAARIKQILPKRKIYKIGADQFAVIIESDKATCISEIGALFTIFTTPFVFKNEEFNLTASIGFNYITNFTQKQADVISNTEFALLNSKKFSSNYCEYDDNSIRNTQTFQLVKDIKLAIANKQLEIFYQPQVDNLTHKVYGAEALVRWRHPTKGLIPPFNFLPIAEEYNLIEEIDRFVLIKAISDINTFSKNNLKLAISVNFSSKTVCNSDTVKLVQKYLHETKIDPSLLTIEITETSLMEDLVKSKDVILQLSQMGVKIAIDDFGTGYSSMGYLMRYPTDYLKIDREFIKNIDTEDALQIVTSNLIKLGHSLSMTVVAEGVETEAELNILKEYGCDVTQGFYFSKPLPCAEFLNYVQKMGFSPLKSIII